MAKKVTPFLMFDAVAEEAMRLYVETFPASEVRTVEKYGADAGPMAGKIKRADFTVAGQDVICIDSPVKHAFTFTPSLSLFVDCASEVELDAAFERLSAEGSVLMPPGDYGFSKKFVWLSDRFGVSWQLNLT